MFSIPFASSADHSNNTFSNPAFVPVAAMLHRMRIVVRVIRAKYHLYAASLLCATVKAYVHLQFPVAHISCVCCLAVGAFDFWSDRLIFTVRVCG
jgi:hypothetical protein